MVGLELYHGVFLSASYSHGGAVNWVVLYEVPPRHLVFVVDQVEQGFAHLLLVDTNDGVSHGEHFHHVRCDPESQVDID